jgi:hypothetical protein
MKTVYYLLAVVISCSFLTASGNAALTLTFSPPKTFFTNSGIQPIEVFVISSVATGEARAQIGGDFTLGNVGASQAVFNSPNAGTFGGVGFLGNGNILSQASAFTPDLVLANVASLNINFGTVEQAFDEFGDPILDGQGNPTFEMVPAAQRVPNTTTALATLLINTNGLAVGSYSINFTAGFFGSNTIANASSSFNITAVPEPSSFLLLAICSAGIYYRHRRSSIATAA